MKKLIIAFLGVWLSVICPAFADATPAEGYSAKYAIDAYMSSPGFIHLEIAHWKDSLFFSARSGNDTFGAEETFSSDLEDDLCRLADRIQLTKTKDCKQNFAATFGLSKVDSAVFGTYLKQPGDRTFIFEIHDGKVIILTLPSYTHPSMGTPVKLASGITFSDAIHHLCFD